MRRSATSLSVACLMFVAMTGASFASCAQSLAILEKQVDLIAAAAPLAADPDLSPGPADAKHTFDNPLLTERTSQAFDVFKPPATESRETMEWGFPANLARARESLGRARDALNRGDEAACEQAVTVGLEAAQRARDWLRTSAAPR